MTRRSIHSGRWETPCGVVTAVRPTPGAARSWARGGAQGRDVLEVGPRAEAREVRLGGVRIQRGTVDSAADLLEFVVEGSHHGYGPKAGILTR